jgi:hypothetical protein
LDGVDVGCASLDGGGGWVGSLVDWWEFGSEVADQRYMERWTLRRVLWWVARLARLVVRILMCKDEVMMYRDNVVYTIRLNCIV